MSGVWRKTAARSGPISSLGFFLSSTVVEMRRRAARARARAFLSNAALFVCLLPFRRRRHLAALECWQSRLAASGTAAERVSNGGGLLSAEAMLRQLEMPRVR